MYKFFGSDFNIFWLIEAFLVAILLSSFIYLEWLGFTYPWLNTLLALVGLFLLLRSDPRVWSWSGFLIALFWFWWIALSFEHYGFGWATPIGIILVTSIYLLIFWFFIKSALYIEKRWQIDRLYLKALFIFGFSTIHPFGFDWLKFELVFVDSYFGINKWQFALILVALVLLVGCNLVHQKHIKKSNSAAINCILRVSIASLLFIISLDFSKASSNTIDQSIKLINTNVTIHYKWDKAYEQEQIDNVYRDIQEAIDHNYSIVVLPESVIPKFINKFEGIKDRLKRYSNDIAIVMGGLYLDDDGTPRNSAYIFTKDKMQVANKVILVPFGEQNPLPEFLSDIVNKIFYDGAVDYKASSEITEYQLNGTSYRNAICFEATSERLYEGKPKYMIALSNNGWFTPSIEPTLQKLLLKYYSKKYGTTIYHSINQSPSYIIYDGRDYP